MIRVQPNRCGYREYTCVGTPALDSMYADYGLVCDLSVRNRVSDFIVDDPVSGIHNYIDNYNNLPTKFKGFMMSQPYVHDFSIGDAGSYTPVPEVACMTDINPFSDSGFIDAYNVYKSKTDARAWPNDQYALLQDTLPCCVDVTDNAGIITVTEGELEPGILEPIINPLFTIEAPPPVPPPGTDPIIEILSTIPEWRKEINARINDLEARSTDSGVAGIRALIYDMQLRSICKNDFVISRTSGDPLQRKPTSASSPVYSISGGTIKINNRPGIEVKGISGIRGPFYAYVCVTLDKDTNTGYYSEISAWISTSYDSSADYCLGIGGVQLINSTSYYLYEIVQERCTFLGTVIKADQGILWYDGHSNMKAYEVAECSDNS